MPVEQFSATDLYNAGESRRTGTRDTNNAQMYGSPTLSSGGVSKSAGISGWHIPQTHTGAPQ